MKRIVPVATFFLSLLATALGGICSEAGAQTPNCVPSSPACLMRDEPLSAVTRMPPLTVQSANQVPSCVTPAALMTFVIGQNKLREQPEPIDPRFKTLADEYKRFGQIHQIRWDYAFFQMMDETGHLSFTTQDKQTGKWVPGAVRPEHNNFAGVGATVTGGEGEKFGSVPLGVEAHFKHLVIYSGRRVQPPMAKRTCEVQTAVIACAAKLKSRAVTFTDMAKQWSGEPTHNYGTVIKSIACRFAAQQRCPAVVLGTCPH